MKDRAKLPRIGLRCSMAAGFFLGGCAAQPSTTSRQATVLEKNVEKARGPYWYNQPAVASVDCGKFDVLWDTCTNLLRDLHFTIDRTDYRSGFLTTMPLVSKQPFEVWRRDVVDSESGLQSAIGTVRRTVHIEITKSSDGGYRCVPKVLVERESYAERRITSVNEYRDVFSYNRSLSERNTDEGQPIQIDYWYAIGRDNALEKSLVHQIHQHLKSRQCDE